MNDRTIEINRNIIEKFLMRVKSLLKNNFKRVLYSMISVFVLIVLIISGIVYINSMEKKELAEFEKIIDEYYSMDEKDRKENGIQKTIDDLNRVMDSSIWGYVHENGYYVMGGLYLTADKYKEGKEYLLKFADKSSSSFFAPFALHRAGLACEKLNDINEAFELYTRLENKYKNYSIRDEIYYDLGRIYQQKGDLLKAKENFIKVIAEYPVSIFAAEAKKRLLLIGESAVGNKLEM